MGASTLSVLVGTSLLAFSFYRFIVYPLFLSPLSKIPNAHPTAPISPAWILWQRYRCHNNKIVDEAHRKLGPIVRLAPNELSVNCVEGGIRTVYAGGFDKHEWYPEQFGSYGVISMFSMTLTKPHSNRKRMISNIYSKTYLQSSPHLAAISHTMLSTRFFPTIQDAAETSTSVEVHDMNNGWTMDFMSAYQFGLPSSTNFSVNPERRKHLLHVYHSRRPWEFHSSEIPNLTRWCNKLGIPIVPKAVADANDELEVWGLSMCDSADMYLGPGVPSGAEPTVYKQLKTSMMKANSTSSSKPSDPESPTNGITPAQRLEIACEMLDHLGAGHETSAIALTYLYYEMSRRPSLQAALRTELLTLSPPILHPSKNNTNLDLPHPKQIDSLPLLNAILQETLRLHAPIPGNQPRVTPPNATLCGYTNLPANVRVNASAYSLHRNADVFPQPLEWRPERWLENGPESEARKEMDRWFWAFGSGGRMCVGSNLALQEIKLIVAAIYTNYTTSIVDDEGIEETDAYTIRPTSNKLVLKFEHV